MKIKKPTKPTPSHTTSPSARQDTCTHKKELCPSFIFHPWDKSLYIYEIEKRREEENFC
jgi:hypothetical protein